MLKKWRARRFGVAALVSAALVGYFARRYSRMMNASTKAAPDLGQVASEHAAATSRIFHAVARFSCTVTVVFFAFVGAIWKFQTNLIFQPHIPKGCERPDRNPFPMQHPGQMGMLFEDVWFSSRDGVKLHGWLIKVREKSHAVPTVVFFQGNAGNMGFRLANIAKLIRTCGVNVFAVSYRGYGFSEGNPSEEGVYLDAEAALDHLIQRGDIDRSKIFVFGRSIGGAVAIDLVSKRSKEVSGLIVENSFTSLKEMVPIVFPPLRFFSRVVALGQRVVMNSLAKIPSIDQTPILFISGLQDSLVPPSHVGRLFQCASRAPFKELKTIPAGGHNDSWQADPVYFEYVHKFIEKALSGCLTKSTDLKDGEMPES